MCKNTSLQGSVRFIALFHIFATTIVGTLSIICGGSLEKSIVGMGLNVLIAIVLFTGATTKDTTHLVVWSFFSFFQEILLIIGIWYFAYNSVNSRNVHELRTLTGLFYSGTNDRIWFLRVIDRIYCGIFCLLALLLFLSLIVVKQFYDQLESSESRPVKEMILDQHVLEQFSEIDGTPRQSKASGLMMASFGMVLGSRLSLAGSDIADGDSSLASMSSASEASSCSSPSGGGSRTSFGKNSQNSSSSSSSASS